MACISKRRERWVIDFYDQQGRRRWETMKKGTTKKEANERLRDIEKQINKGSYLPQKKVPFFKKVAKDWIEYKKTYLRATTWSVYEGIPGTILMISTALRSTGSPLLRSRNISDPDKIRG